MSERIPAVYIICIILELSVSVCSSRKNVLFLMVDDLRTHIGAYEDSLPSTFVHPKIYTPHIDSLASRSLLFKRAYVQQTLCTPSRASILTGRRPDTTHVYTIRSQFRNEGGNFTTLPQYFKQNGYASIGMGKVFGKKEMLSWSKRYFSASYFMVKLPVKEFYSEGDNSWLAVPDEELSSKPLMDRKVANYAIESLRKVAKAGDNFFMAVGFRKPHLPYVFPKSFMDKYYPENVIQLPSNPYVPKNMPGIAWNNYVRSLQDYNDIKAMNLTDVVNTTLPDKKALQLRRAYYSTVTWIDSLVGDVIKELHDLGLANNTIISFVSDHGYHLGENGMWLKTTNFEIATRTPMMLHIPGLTDNGIQTDQLVETVDIFQTLVEAAGLEKLPECPEYSSKIELCTEGISLMPLIKYASTPLKSAAFSQIRRGSNTMGYTIRTKRYRYTEWVPFRPKPVYKPNWYAVIARELYDHTIDPEENFNRANDTRYTDVASGLSVKLRLGWRHATQGLKQEGQETSNTMKNKDNVYFRNVFYAICFTLLVWTVMLSVRRIGLRKALRTVRRVANRSSVAC